LTSSVGIHAKKDQNAKRKMKIIIIMNETIFRVRTCGWKTNPNRPAAKFVRLNLVLVHASAWFIWPQEVALVQIVETVCCPSEPLSK